MMPRFPYIWTSKALHRIRSGWTSSPWMCRSSKNGEGHGFDCVIPSIAYAWMLEQSDLKQRGLICTSNPAKG